MLALPPSFYAPPGKLSPATGSFQSQVEHFRTGPSLRRAISSQRHPLPRAEQQRDHDRDVERIPCEPVQERGRIGAGGVEDHAGHPATERHAEYRSKDNDTDAGGSLGG